MSEYELSAKQKKDIEFLLSLNEGWDEEHNIGEPFKQKTIDKAIGVIPLLEKKFYDGIGKKLTEKPGFEIGDTDGTIYLHWQQEINGEHYELVGSVSPIDTEITYYGDNHKGKEIKGKISLDDKE